MIPQRLFLYTGKHYVLMEVTHTDGIMTLTPAAADTTTYNRTKPAGPPTTMFLTTATMKRFGTDHVVRKRIKQLTDVVISDTTKTYVTITFSEYKSICGKLSPNVSFVTTGDAIEHVPPVVPRRKLFTSGLGELCLYVAKQLYDLAVLRKEQCPITVEEFSQGNTAVMPCGHLFMQMAIEESFKKEPNKCPSCRQEGKPTYV